MAALTSPSPQQHTDTVVRLRTAQLLCLRHWQMGYNSQIVSQRDTQVTSRVVHLNVVNFIVITGWQP